MSETKSWTLVGVPFEGGAPTTGARASYAVINKYLKTARPEVLGCFKTAMDLDGDRWRYVDRNGVISGFAGIANSLQGGALSIGGCHTITYYAVQALRRRYPDLALVIFDAHSDASQTRGEFVSHGNFVRNLYRRRPLPIIAVGLRGDEAKLDDLSATVLPAVDVNLPATTEWLRERLRSLGERPVYLTIDVDVLDPAICPGVNHPIGGGLTAEELAAFVKIVCEHGIIGADVVEYVPGRDPQGRGLPIIADLLETIASQPVRYRDMEAAPATLAPETDGTGSTGSMRRSVRRLVKIGYSLGTDEITTRYQLNGAKATPLLAEYASRVCPGIVGVSQSLSELDTRKAAVVGGPCLYQTGGSVSRVTLRELLDLLSPIALAAFTGSPCVLYFELEEARLNENEPADDLLALYADLLNVMQATALAYAARQGLSPADLTFAVTVAPEVDDLLTDAVLRFTEEVADESLDGLYAIDGRSLFPRHHDLAGEFRQLWRRSLVTYLPEVVGRLCDRRIDSVIAAENLDQARVIQLAGELARGTVEHGRVGQVAHLSAPGLSGLPMQRCHGRDRLYAWPPTHAMRALARSQRDVAEFYSWAWPDRWFDAGDSRRETIFTVLALYADAIRRLESRSNNLFAAPINPPNSI